MFGMNRSLYSALNRHGDFYYSLTDVNFAFQYRNGIILGKQSFQVSLFDTKPLENSPLRFEINKKPLARKK